MLGCLERQPSAIGRSKIADDRESEARTRLRFIQAHAALTDFSALFGRKPWPVVFDRDPQLLALRGRLQRLDRRRQINAAFSPLAGIVEKIAEHLLEVLLLALKLGAGLYGHNQRDAFFAMNALDGPDERLSGLFDAA